MRIALLVLALTACGFPKPADHCDGTCGVWAIDHVILNAGDEIWLDGTFEEGTMVSFPFGDEVALNERYDHRASVTVPSAGPSADLSIITTSDGARGKVPFRKATFKPKLQPFTAVNEQNDYARINYVDRVHTGGTAITIGSQVYLIGGMVDGAATPDLEVADAGLDGSLGKPRLLAMGLAEQSAYHTTIRIGRYVYMVGGLIDSKPSNKVARAEIDTENKLSGFFPVQGVSLITSRYGHQSAIIGNYLYVFGGTGPLGDLDTVERARIDEFDGIGDFEPVNGVTMTTARTHFAIVKGANYIYAIGGLHAGLPVASVEKMEMFGNGDVSGSQEAGHLAQPRADHAALVLGNTVYVFAGSGNAGPLPTVESAQFSQEGTLDFNGVPDNLLTEAKAGAAVTIIGNYVYVIGGQRSGGGPATLVERASIIDLGKLDTFAAEPVALNVGRAMHTSVVIGKWLYVIGGQNGSGALDSIEIAEIRPTAPDGSLGEFHLYQTALKKARYGHMALIVDNVLYIIGGIDSAGNVLDTIETMKINEDGSLEQPQTHLLRLFTPRGRATMFAQGNYAYAFGGRISTGPNTDTSSLEFGTFADGATFTGFSDYNVDTIKETREGAASIALGQFFYVIGGDDNGMYRGITQVARPTIDVNFASPFALAGNSLTSGRSGHVVTSVGETLYAIGGTDTGSTVESAKVFRDGTFGPFAATTGVTLMTNRRGASTVTIGNYVYVIGGQAVAGPYLVSLERATIR